MNFLSDAVNWLNDPLNWTNPDGILALARQHLFLSGAAVLLACLVAWPLGLWLGHTGRGGEFVVALANLGRAVPVLALLTIFAVTPLGFGAPSVIVALAVFAVPPLLANAYLGLREIDPEVREAARGMGLSGWQLLRRVEVPLAVRYLAAGFRTASVQVVATATLAAYVDGGGLGTIIRLGFGVDISVGGGRILAGAILVAVLCLALDGILALTQRAVTPRPLRS